MLVELDRIGHGCNLFNVFNLNILGIADGLKIIIHLSIMGTRNGNTDSYQISSQLIIFDRIYGFELFECVLE